MPRSAFVRVTPLGILPLAMVLLLLAPGCSDAPTGPGAGIPTGTPLPLLFSWGRPESGPIVSVNGIGETRDGTIFILDGRSRRIERFRPTGERLPAIDLTAGGIGSRLDTFDQLVVGQDEDLYLTRLAVAGTNTPAELTLLHLAPTGELRGRLEIFGRDSTQVGSYQTPYVVNAQGRIFVVDTQRYRVVVFDGSGHVVRTWGTRCSDPGGFEQPTTPLLTPEGDLIVYDTDLDRGQRFSPEGTFATFLFETSEDWARLRGQPPVGIDAKGAIYFRNGVGTFERYDTDGRWLGTMELQEPVDPAFDPYLWQSIYVARDGGFISQVYDQTFVVLTTTDGRPSLSLGDAYGSAPFDLDGVRDMAVAPGGDVALLKYDSSRVLRFSDRGVFKESWGSEAEHLDVRFVALAFDGSGRLFSYDISGESIVELLPGGGLRTHLILPSRPGAPYPIFADLFQVTLDGAVITRDRGDVLYIAPTGELRRVVHSEHEIESFALDGRGRLWLLSVELEQDSAGNVLLRNYLQILTADGEMVRSVDITAATGDSALLLTQIRAEPDGGAWAYDLATHDLLRFDTRGNVLSRHPEEPLRQDYDTPIYGVDRQQRLLRYDAAPSRVAAFDIRGVR